MQIIIPLGGLGNRFQKCGYNKPKPIIKILGKEIIFWLLDSLSLKEEDIIYIAYNKLLDSYGFSRLINLKYPKIKMLAVPNTRGSAETVKICIDSFGINGRIAVLDGDTWYEENILEKIRSNSGNLVTYFESKTTEPIYSYIIKKEDRIIEISEKKKISDNANSGCYVFSEAKIFSSTVKSMDLNSSQETYISQVIAKMILEGQDFKAIEVNQFHVLGTPEQAIRFANCFKLEPKRFCFDLDNTLVTAPKIKGDYSTVEPIEEVINCVKKLKNAGHKIIIYTARRMKTHSGNIGSVFADIGSVTLETLDRFGIPFDEVYFGKPYADFYIDDLMINPRFDLNKELGFYMEEVQPRYFNFIDKSKTFKKLSYSKKILGEIHYYKWLKNCSKEIKGLFPNMIDHGEEWLEIDLIEGLNLSTLYLNQIVTEDIIDKILTILRKLHAENNGEEIFYRYDNFSTKFLSRMEMYDYKKYGISNQYIIKIRDELDSIDSQGFKKVMIHGDPVFSNIMIDVQGKIKMVDMRGMEGEELTVYGHELYDFAKIYQSICGYDEVLLNKNVDMSYKKSFINQFEKNFSSEEMKKIRIIATSLFLSLIPLHKDEDKYKKYIDIALSLV